MIESMVWKMESVREKDLLAGHLTPVDGSSLQSFVVNGKQSTHQSLSSHFTTITLFYFINYPPSIHFQSILDKSNFMLNDLNRMYTLYTKYYLFIHSHQRKAIILHNTISDNLINTFNSFPPTQWKHYNLLQS